MEENWIKDVKKKDELAFNSLVERHKRGLYLIAKARLDVEADIEDAIQETLFDVYREIWHLKDEKNFKTWVTRILINNCNDIIRDNKNTILYFNDEIINKVEDEHNEYLELESNQNFFELIDFLTEEEKNIIIMRYSQDFNISEMSEILNIREGTLRMKIFRIKEKIREKYENRELDI